MLLQRAGFPFLWLCNIPLSGRRPAPSSSLPLGLGGQGGADVCLRQILFPLGVYPEVRWTPWSLTGGGREGAGG